MDPQVTLTERDQALLSSVQQKWELAESEHARHRPRWVHFNGLYHNFTDWREQTLRDQPDRDIGLQDIHREWGAQLFIPLTFTLIESMLPDLVANDPDMVLRPPAMGREEQIQAVKALIERQSHQMDFQLKLQDVGKSGLMFGLGVGKTFWRKEYRTQRALQKHPLPGMLLEGGARAPEWVASQPKRVCSYDDPDFEWVDIFDFRWDPFGHDLRTLSFLFHRTWRSHSYVMEALSDEGPWKTDGFTLTEEDVRGLSSAEMFHDAWADRWRSQGYSPGAKREGGEIHEVWEYHTGEEVVTVLDRKIIVQRGPNPHWHGEYPFQVYRPTKNLGQLVGKSAIEPGEDLQDEMNVMRSQRRDNASFVVNRSFAYQEGAVDPADLKVGPGTGIPVLGPPDQLLHPLPMGDIPHSSYQEEDRLVRDYERTTGLNDAMAIAQGNTATEAQFVQQAVSKRLRLMTKRLSREVVRSCSRQVLAMDQQRIRENRDIAIPSPPTPGEGDRRWTWLKVGPEELQGEWAVEPDDASMVPVNVAQDRQDAQQIATVFGQPMFQRFVDPRRLLGVLARKYDLQPDELRLPDEPRVPPVALDLLAEAGVPQELIEQAVQTAEAAEAEGETPEWPPREVVDAHEEVAENEERERIQEAVEAAGVPPPGQGSAAE